MGQGGNLASLTLTCPSLGQGEGLEEDTKPHKFQFLHCKMKAALRSTHRGYREDGVICPQDPHGSHQGALEGLRRMALGAASSWMPGGRPLDPREGGSVCLAYLISKIK